MTSHDKTTKGEIATTLTVISLVVILLGTVLGSRQTARQERQQYQSQAQTSALLCYKPGSCKSSADTVSCGPTMDCKNVSRTPFQNDYRCVIKGVNCSISSGENCWCSTPTQVIQPSAPPRQATVTQPTTLPTSGTRPTTAPISSPTAFPTPTLFPARITPPTGSLTATPDCKLSSFAQITYGNNQPLTIKNPSAWLYKNSKGSPDRFERSSDGTYFRSKQYIVEDFNKGTGSYRKGDNISWTLEYDKSE